MVERTNPRLGEIIFDPACGTGGFLTCSLEHIRKHEVKSPADEQRLQESIRGVEKKPLPHLLCVTNMLLHGIEVPVNIRHDNTLARPYASYTSTDRVDVILTNPPFGSMEEDGTEKNFPATYPSGVKSYNKTKPIRIEEFDAEKKWWGKPGQESKRKENEFAWRVSIDQIKAGNYSLDFKNPHSSDTGPGDVDHLLPEYEKLLAQIAKTRAELKNQLQEALSR